jgi:hypothetical protein
VPARSQNAVHFREGSGSVREEHQSKLAQYQVKAAIAERELLRPSLTPFDSQTLLFGRCTSHCEHVRIEVEADNHSTRSNARRNVPGNDTGSTRHIQDTLARLRIRSLN